MALVSYKITDTVTPRIISDIDLLANRSFELGTLGAVPTSWIGASVSPAVDPVISETRFWNRGTLPGLRSVKLQPELLGTAWLYQDTAINNVVLNRNIICCLKFWPDGPSQPQLRITVEGYDILGALQEAVAGNLGGFTFGAWNTIEFILQLTDSTITRYRLHLQLTDGFSDGEAAYVDYLHFGLLHDLKREFDFWKTKEVPQGATHIGNGNHQSVNFGNEQMQVEFGYKEVGVFGESDTDNALLDVYSEVELAKEVSLWNDFTKWTNQDRHFERLVMTREFARKLKRGGFDRYLFNMKADAPNERVVVPAVLS